MADKLKQIKCSACRGDEPPLTEKEIEDLLPQVPEWDVVKQDGIDQLRRTFKFRNFVQALAFANEVGAVAEEEGHHPVIELTWGRVTVIWYTHKIKGLHQNDFIMAAKTDMLAASS
jgi:4a-hydroxytetrahydrobiopterin dehydratase